MVVGEIERINMMYVGKYYLREQVYR